MVFSRKTTFITAVLEAALAVAAGLGVILVPLTILWAVENNATIDWMAAYRASADIWLAAHGVQIMVPAGTIVGIQTPDFVLSLIPLGLSALIFSSAYRMGKRIAATTSLWPGWVGALGVYGAMSLVITTSAHHKLAYPIETQGIYQPVIVYGLVLVASSLFAKPIDLGASNLPEAQERLLVRTWLAKRIDGVHWAVRAIWLQALRAGTAVVFTLTAASALIVAVSLGANWIQVIRLYEGMQLSLFGGILLTVGQIALMPNIVIYGADWLTGAGFYIGSGSWVSPIASQLGPLPSLPVLAALPSGVMSFGLVAIAVPIVAAFLATLGIRKYADEIRFEFASALSAAMTLGIGIGVVAAVEVLVLNLLASGAAGPGRLQEVGGNPWIVAGVLFVETAVVATLAAFYSAKPEGADDEVIARAQQPRG
jgi:hypothetical protein